MFWKPFNRCLGSHQQTHTFSLCIQSSFTASSIAFPLRQCAHSLALRTRNLIDHLHKFTVHSVETFFSTNEYREHPHIQLNQPKKTLTHTHNDSKFIHHQRRYFNLLMRKISLNFPLQRHERASCVMAKISSANSQVTHKTNACRFRVDNGRDQFVSACCDDGAQTCGDHRG